MTASEPMLNSSLSEREQEEAWERRQRRLWNDEYRSKKELITACRFYRLHISGTKKVLVSRLMGSIEAKTLSKLKLERLAERGKDEMVFYDQKNLSSEYRPRATYAEEFEEDDNEHRFRRVRWLRLGDVSRDPDDVLHFEFEDDSFAETGAESDSEQPRGY